MPQQFLVIKGCAGLGNRLFTLAGAIAFAKASRRALIIDWADGQFAPKGQNAFGELFSLDGISYAMEYPPAAYEPERTFYPSLYKQQLEQGVYDLFEFRSAPSIFRKIPYRLLAGPLKKWRGYWSPLNGQGPARDYNLWQFAQKAFHPDSVPPGHRLPLNRREDFLFFQDFRPLAQHDLLTRHLRLHPAIAEIVRAFTGKHQLQQNTLGLHVRFTDKKPEQTLQHLFQKIEGMGLSHPNIFLATDSIEVEKAFQERYGERLIRFPKFLPEVSTEGIHQWSMYQGQEERTLQIARESVVDMWLLANCEYLFYQGNSSFSLISKLFHSNPEKVMDWQQ